ncbi:helicase DnaB [Domibacillus antri]|uniref:Helicase DnaB n=1 Tax=Domibacillus antri TaxID=1714264 RepID=A0A1Q8Q1W7_9BACI|nr:AAA family ATPase [Domibacillus antri]OLN21336.1 helicase DnaB [Domibacillus antri]
MKVITFFNNKGGVGKTTLTVNIASYMALMLEKKILVIDADPQSNTTQMMLDEVSWERIYSDGSTETTLLSYLDPVFLGDSTLDLNHEPFPNTDNRFGVDLIPGHPRLSLLEDKLSNSWNNCTAGDPGGFRVTNWVKSLTNHFKDDYDYIIFDIGPSLGALNRSILLNSDAFITPMGCDIFSLMGIQNISEWINSWETIYKSALNVLREKHPSFDYQKYQVNIDISDNYYFIGYSVQQYITKVIDGERRGIASYDRIKQEIPGKISKYLSGFLPNETSMEDCELGDIPHLWSLIPLAQSSNSPIHQLKKSDGLVGNQYKIMRDYAAVMDSVCKQILKNLGEDVV